MMVLLEKFLIACVFKRRGYFLVTVEKNARLMLDSAVFTQLTQLVEKKFRSHGKVN